MKKYQILILLLTIMMFSGCAVDGLDDMSQYWSIRSQESEYQENVYSSYLESERSRKEESSRLESERKASEREASKKEASEKERLRQESLKKAEENKTDEEHLRDYVDRMVTSGQGIIPSTKKPYYWKMNKFSLDDFNNDKQPELILQYYVSDTKDYAKYGVALEIVRYIGKQYCSFKPTTEMSDYIVSDVKTTLSHIVCDELYVDAEKNLAIMHTSLFNSNPVAVSYNSYILRKNKMSHEESLYVTVEDYKGKNNVFNPNKCGFAVSGNDFLVYRFFTDARMTNYYSKDIGGAHQNSVVNINRYDIFSVKDSAVHLLEENNNYDSSKVKFCTLDEIEAAYNKRNEEKTQSSAQQ